MRGACPGSTEEGRCSGRISWGVAAELGGKGGWSTHQPGKEVGKYPRGKVGGVGPCDQGAPRVASISISVCRTEAGGTVSGPWQDMIQMLNLLLRATGSY